MLVLYTLTLKAFTKENEKNTYKNYTVVVNFIK